MAIKFVPRVILTPEVFTRLLTARGLLIERRGQCVTFSDTISQALEIMAEHPDDY